MPALGRHRHTHGAGCPEACRGGTRGSAWRLRCGWLYGDCVLVPAWIGGAGEDSHVVARRMTRQTAGFGRVERCLGGDRLLVEAITCHEATLPVGDQLNATAFRPASATTLIVLRVQC